MREYFASFNGGRSPRIKFVGDTAFGRKNHIDYLINYDTGKFTTLEFKARRKDYGDFLLEYQSSGKGGRTVAGWWWKTKAKVLLYLILSPLKAYIIDLQALRRKLGKKLWRYPSHFSQNPDYKTFFKVIPLADVPHVVLGNPLPDNPLDGLCQI